MQTDIDERIEMVEPDAQWASWYAQDAAELRRALGERLRSVEHFGSTAVLGLRAKPIIDILVAPTAWPLAAHDRNILVELGYEYLGEAGIPGREYFRRRTAHATNLAVVRWADELWNDNLAIRDYLRANQDVATQYGEAKRRVWESGARTLLEYSRAKHEFVDQLLTRARAWRDASR